MKNTQLFYSITLVISFLFLQTQCLAQSPDQQPQEKPKEESREIIFGQSAFLTEGSLELYGELIRNAIIARFKRINNAGGIHGKVLRLESYDDRGEADLTKKNIEQMINKNITMFLGNMGTRGIIKALPLIEQKRIAMLFPWGGAKELRQPQYTNLVNGTGWIEPQIKELVAHAIKTLSIRKIAIFHDDSSFGIANKNLAIAEMKKYGVEPVATSDYNRYTMDIQHPSKKLLETDPKLVLCLATSIPTVKLISYFLEHGHFGTKFIGIDSTMFVGTILKRRGVDYSYASPMPDPQKSNLPIVKEFREDMKAFAPNDPLNILSLSYYIHAAIITQALKMIEGPMTQEKLLAKIESMKNYDLGGFLVNFDSATRQAYPHNISILTSNN